ncbi:MAG: ABC transporter ATP-binding protein [Bacilli bacterium]|nr:ABC transporter ATP-binding protein [Bacilli bacterium]MDD4076994.1 ABC transporter ATP-binding protein [Bacilli bacterium]
MKIIELKNVTKKYRRKTVFSSFSYLFEQGKTYLFVGDNGSGKTTLIKGLLKLIRFSGGSMKMAPVKYTFLPERIDLPETITVENFLINIGLIKGVTNIKDKTVSLLKEWDLEGNKKIKELSKGMRQKILIIQLLLDDADLYFFDEPLSGLDSFSRNRFLSLIRELKKSGKTLIISSHYPDHYSYDKILHFANGEIHEGFN